MDLFFGWFYLLAVILVCGGRFLWAEKKKHEELTSLLVNILTEVTSLRTLQQEASKIKSDETLLKYPVPTRRVRTRENDDID